MCHSLRNTVWACVFMSVFVCVCIHECVCVGVCEERGSSQQMCSMRWQHDVYFACSIWHVWVLPCILSRCEVMARDARPPRIRSLVVSAASTSQRLPRQLREKRAAAAALRRPCQLFCFSDSYFFSFRFLWATEQTKTNCTIQIPLVSEPDTEVLDTIRFHYSTCKGNIVWRMIASIIN